MPQTNLSDLARQQIFTDPQNENFECAAGTEQLRAFLETDKLGKGFAVLSSLSLYCKGACYIQKLQERRKKLVVEYRVDIPEISRVNYVRISQNWLFGLCLLFGFLAPVILLLGLVAHVGSNSVLNPLLDAGICAILAAIFALEYSMRKKTLLQFTYPNGSIALDSKDLDPKEEQILVKRLNVLRREWQERTGG